MAMHEKELAKIFGALSDPTRLRVVERLATGPASVSDLAAPFSMAGPSFLKHLKVLENAGLTASQKTGRVRIVHLAPEAMSLVESWLQSHRDTWNRRLDDLATFLEGDLQ